VAQATPRLSRGAAKLKCEGEDRRKRWPRRNDENPEEAESQESNGLRWGGSPTGYGLHGWSKALKPRRTMIFQKTSEWKTVATKNGKRATAPKGVRLPAKEQSSEGKTP
jgi:hypothetical protein